MHKVFTSESYTNSPQIQIIQYKSTVFTQFYCNAVHPIASFSKAEEMFHFNSISIRIFLYKKNSLQKIWKSEFRHSEITSLMIDDIFISVEILIHSLPYPVSQCKAIFTNISTKFCTISKTITYV